MFAPIGDAPGVQVNGAVGLMHVLNDLSVLLTTLPAGSGTAGRTRA